MPHDGQTLDQLLEELGVKKKLLAEKLDVHQNTISNWTKRSTLSNDILISIGKAIRFDLSSKFTRLKKVPEASALNFFNSDPNQLLDKVETIDKKFDNMVQTIANKDQEIRFLKERINSLQEIIEMKNEIIETIKGRK